VIGLYKIELVKAQRPWRVFDDLEITTPNGSTGSTTAAPSGDATTPHRSSRDR
jgi:hypothetical protein